MAAPISFAKTDCEGFRSYLDSRLAQHHPAIYSVQMMLRENLFGFQGNQKSPYLKITVTDPKYINRLRSMLEDGNFNYKSLWKGVDGGILTFDSIQYVLRFMIDTGVSTAFEKLIHVLTNILDLWNVVGISSSREIPYDPLSRSAFKLSN